MGQVSVGIGIAVPGVSIGINFPAYPDLVPVPGYPVYYARQARSNYFFYDGMYWVYQGDNWYASSWYNGPWWLVEVDAVPLYVLRVPVRYYRQPPPYFRGWRSDAPPRWGERWGKDWNERHRDWDKWDRRAVPAPAPLPRFQKQYSGNRYPPAEQQAVIQGRNYRHEPREPVVRQHYEAQGVKRVAPAAAEAPRHGPPNQGRAAPQDPRGADRSAGSREPGPPAQRAEPPAGQKAKKQPPGQPAKDRDKDDEREGQRNNNK